LLSKFGEAVQGRTRSRAKYFCDVIINTTSCDGVVQKHKERERERKKEEDGGLWRILSSNKWPVPVSISCSGLASFQGGLNIEFDYLKRSGLIWSSLFQHWPGFGPARALRDV